VGVCPDRGVAVARGGDGVGGRVAVPPPPFRRVADAAVLAAAAGAARRGPPALTRDKSFDFGRRFPKVRAGLDGVVAQLVEHHNGIVGVRSSNLLGSTIYFGPLTLISPNVNGPFLNHPSLLPTSACSELMVTC
jgi:hypothetical protein